jgi:hypothetical protein
VTTTSKKDRAQLACIQHRVKTKNWHELENHVTRDKDVNIVTRYKKGKETATNARDCT